MRNIRTTVPSSLYIADKAAFVAYNPAKHSSFFVAPSGVAQPYEVPGGRLWSGLSDRAVPSVQVTRGWSSRRTAGAPGGMTPGGSGVDVKHGSAARRLNRLKVQGGLRHSRIVSGCACPGENSAPQLTCMPPVAQMAPVDTPVAQVGAAVLAARAGTSTRTNAVITHMDGEGVFTTATVRFANGDTEVVSIYDLVVLHKCCAALHKATVDGPSILDNCCPVPPVSLHDQILVKLKGGQNVSGDLCRLQTASALVAQHNI